MHPHPSDILYVEIGLARGEDGQFRVQLSSDGVAQVEDEFTLEVPEGSQMEEKLEKIEDNTCDYSDLNYAGTKLWVGLLSGKCKAAWEALSQKRTAQGCVHLRLTLPALPFSQKYLMDMRAFPWEALYDEAIGSLAGDPRFCIVRQAPGGSPVPELRPVEEQALRMLVIIPTGSGLDAAQELTNIRHEGAKLKRPLEITELVGAVTPDRLGRALNEHDPDLVHFVGHGAVDKSGRVTVELNDAAGNPLPMDAEILARDLANPPRSIRLAVLNCCEGDKVNPAHSMSGFGALLRRKGIPAVVSMRYEIKDTLAILFSQTFYQTLFSGPAPGRVDIALETARGALLRNSQSDTVRGFVTPVLHLAKGYEQLFPLTASPSSLLVTREAAGAASNLPSALQEAIRSGALLPVLGPGVLSLEKVRRSNGHPTPCAGPEELALIVASDPDVPYPREMFAADFPLCASGGDWMNGMLMHWVCQHHQFRQKGRPALLKKLQDTYGGLEPSPMMRKIARWQVTGMIYTYFDGQLETCVNRGESTLNSVLCGIQAATRADAPVPKPRPLVLVRGSLKQPTSLVLTEEDCEDLLESIPRMPATTASLARETGSSVVFLGVSPRDPLVRALARQILDTTSRRMHGPTFWIWPNSSEVHRAYWSRYAVEWIPDPINAVIAALNVLQGL